VISVEPKRRVLKPPPFNDDVLMSNQYYLKDSYLLSALFLSIAILTSYNFPSLGNNLTPRNFAGWGVIYFFSFALFLLPLLRQKVFLSKNFLWLLIPIGAVICHPILIPSSEVNDHYPRLIFLTLTGFALAVMAFNQLSVPESTWRLISVLFLTVYAIQLFVSEISIGLGIKPFFDFILPMQLREPAAGFMQRNMAASFGAALIIWAWSFDGFRLSSRILKVIYGISIFTISYFIFESGSKVGFLGLLFGSIFVYLSDRKKNKIPILLITFAFLSSSFLGNSNNSIVKRGGELLSAESSVSTKHRISMYENSLILGMEKPLLGNGLGGFQWAYYDSFARKKEDHPNWYFVAGTDHPHNEILIHWVEMGLYGIAFVVAPILAFGVVWVFSPHQQTMKTIGSMLPIILHTQTEVVLHASGFHWLLLILILVSFRVRKNLSHFEYSRLFALPLVLLMVTALVVSGEAVAKATNSWREYVAAMKKPDLKEKIDSLVASEAFNHWALGTERRENALEAIMVFAIQTGNIKLVKSNLPAMLTVQEKWQTKRQWLIVAQSYVLLGRLDDYSTFVNRIKAFDPEFASQFKTYN